MFDQVGRIGQATVSRDICNPFTLITEITKTGEEQFHVKVRSTTLSDYDSNMLTYTISSIL